MFYLKIHLKCFNFSRSESLSIFYLLSFKGSDKGRDNTVSHCEKNFQSYSNEVKWQLKNCLEKKIELSNIKNNYEKYARWCGTI